MFFWAIVLENLFIVCFNFLYFSTGIPDSMIGRYQTVHDRVTCVVQKHNSNTNNNNDPVLKYKRSNKSGKNVPYVFELPDQVFHFVSTFGTILKHYLMIRHTKNQFLSILLIYFSILFQEMQIKGKKFNQLHWLNYAVVSRYKSTRKSQQSEFNVKDIV